MEKIELENKTNEKIDAIRDEIDSWTHRMFSYKDQRYRLIKSALYEFSIEGGDKYFGEKMRQAYRCMEECERYKRVSMIEEKIELLHGKLFELSGSVGISFINDDNVDFFNKLEKSILLNNI